MPGARRLDRIDLLPDTISVIEDEFTPQERRLYGTVLALRPRRMDLDYLFVIWQRYAFRLLEHKSGWKPSNASVRPKRPGFDGQASQA